MTWIDVTALAVGAFAIGYLVGVIRGVWLWSPKCDQCSHRLSAHGDEEHDFMLADSDKRRENVK